MVTAEKQRIYRANEKRKWRDFKNTIPCARCGLEDGRVLDFHHRDPKQKTGEVNRFVKDSMYTRAYAEVEKCDPLCANCHRIHHHEYGTPGPAGRYINQVFVPCEVIIEAPTLEEFMV